MYAYVFRYPNDKQIQSSFRTFKEAISVFPTIDGLTLSRIEHDGGYTDLYSWSEEKGKWVICDSNKHGGPRIGGGRPRTNLSDGLTWKSFATILSTDVLKWLDQMKKVGYNKNELIVRGLHYLMDNFVDGEWDKKTRK